MTRPALARWLWPVLRLCGTAIILATILRRVEVTGAWEAMRGAPPWVWALPFSMLMCVSAIHALRLRILLGGIGVSCRWATAMGAILRGQFVGLVLPRGGGDLARLAWLSRHTGRSDAVVAVGVGRETGSRRVCVTCGFAAGLGRGRGGVGRVGWVVC